MYWSDKVCCQHVRVVFHSWFNTSLSNVAQLPFSTAPLFSFCMLSNSDNLHGHIISTTETQRPRWDPDPVQVTPGQPAADMKHPDRYKTSTTHSSSLFSEPGFRSLTSAESVELLLAASGDLGSAGGGGRDTWWMRTKRRCYSHSRHKWQDEWGEWSEVTISKKNTEWRSLQSNSRQHSELRLLRISIHTGLLDSEQNKVSDCW